MTTQSLHGDSPTKDNDNTHSPMLGKTSPMLSYFCVYNPSLGTTEENTKDQILYYTAKKVVPADIKMRQVGLAQALVNFASAFSASKPAQNVHTQKNRMVFLQPEPGFWMYMCVELGILKRHIRDSQGKEKLVTEYLDAQLSDQALEAVLKLGYEQFKLLHGTFSAILYGEGGAETVPNRQRRRSLMHCIEEFFSEWIWKWDFDRLDTMVFSAVFNGVQIQPILRSNYLKIHALDAAIQSKFSHAMDHLLVLDTEEGGLVYRSTSLDIKDVCALRKYILKRVEKSMMKEKEAKQRQLEHEQGEIKTNKFLALKSFTKSLSQSQFLGYFTSALPSKGAIPLPTTEPAMPEDASLEPSTELSQEMPFSSSFSSSSSSLLSSSAPAPEPASASASAPTVPITVNGVDIHPQHGKYLTGLIQTTCIDMNGDEKSISRTEMVHVYLNSKSGLDTPTHSSHESTHTTSQQQQQQSLTEYVLIIYKHRNNLIWSFLLPTLAQETEDILSDPMFYRHLEDYMVNDQQLDVITEAVLDNMKSSQEKSHTLEKQYKCFYYDNMTLNIKSTMVNQHGKVISRYQNDGKFIGGIPMTNDILLQMLDLKADFERLPRTTEIYTRSITNYWVAGHRLYNTALTSNFCVDTTKDKHDKSVKKEEEDANEHGHDHSDEAEDLTEDPVGRYSLESLPENNLEDYTEIYLVAAKKDTSLADVEEILGKMTTLLVDVMHLE